MFPLINAFDLLILEIESGIIDLLKLKNKVKKRTQKNQTFFKSAVSFFYCA